MVVRTDSLIETYLQELADLAHNLPRQPLQQAVDLLYSSWQRGGTVFAVGNGGSASTATHLACDLAKATIVPGCRRLRALALVDNIPLVSAWANDNGFASIFAEQMEPWIREGDVLIALSVHGGSGQGQAGPWSQNLPLAAALARERGARVIALAGFGGGALSQMADVAITIPIDVEPLGTPLVESLQVAVHHLLCLALRRRIAENAQSENT